ncbi:MAG: ATP-binding protein [Coriobacteriales bacterium]
MQARWQMIPEKEALSVEFKSDRKSIGDAVIVSEVVALANTEGGDLYIGVEDDGTVTGAQESHRNPVRMEAMVANKTRPSVSVRATLEEEGLPVMRLEVPRSQSVVATSDGKIVRRRLRENGEPECVPMYPYEISTRLSDLGRLDFSAQPVRDATRDDFDPAEMRHLRQLVQDNPASDKGLVGLEDWELERALRLTVRVGEEDVPTLTGLLMVGRQSSLERLVPTHEGAFQVLQGTESRANVSYTQPLLYTIEKIVEHIEPWNPITEVQVGLISQPTPLFDRRAIREAVVNAFGHRDYSVLGRVRMQVDDDGLQVVNPGGFVEGINVRNLLTAEPHGRNPCLMDALKRVGLAERTGRGIDRIYEGSLLYGRPLPDYTESDSTKVSLFIARSEPDVEFVRLLAEERERRGAALPLSSLLVLDALKRSRRCTAEELLSEVDIPSGRIKGTLERLTEAGLVEASGSGKGREYILGRKVYRRSGSEMEYVRQSGIDKVRYPEMIMKLASQQGKVTTSDVMELLHISNSSAAYYEIRKLVDQGRLKSVRAGRGSYYVPVSAG